MTDIFVSYARDDKPLVARLVQVLTREGYSVWWDHELDSGAEFGPTIQSKLQDAKCVVVCWSKKSAPSRWVRDEADMAIKLGTAVPISLDGTLPPLGFGQFHTPNAEAMVAEHPSAVPEIIDNIKKTVAGGRVVALAAGATGKRLSGKTLAVLALAALIAVVAASTFGVRELQNYLAPSAPTRFSQLQSAEMLMSEIDDAMTVIINDDVSNVLSAKYGDAPDWTDVTKLFKQGSNKISITIMNGPYGGCGGRLELKMNGFVAPEHRWAFGTATGITEGRPPNVMCYAQVKTIVLK